MKKNRRYLLIPAMPTPNGALHLGHIGAQFLKLDILHRHLISCGDHSIYLCGLDVFDNAISVVADKEHTDEDTICNNNYHSIKEDMTLFNIIPNEFINWRDPCWRSVWQETLKTVNGRLTDHKKETLESVPFRKDTDQAIVGRWLESQCPKCDGKIHGFSCDPCSLEFSSTEIKNPKSVKGYDLIWKTVPNEFVEVQVSRLRKYHSQIMLPSSLSRVVDEAIDEKATYSSRWTTYDSYGMPTSKPGQVFYNYSFSILEAVAFGEIAKRRFHSSYNAFDCKSNITTIMAYGRDCTSILLLNIPTLMLAAKLKPYDYQVVSPFYLLNNQKMSTNRKFAIWVQELKERPHFSRDAVRAFMTSISVPDTEPNISLSQIDIFLDNYEKEVTQPLEKLIDHPLILNFNQNRLNLNIINSALRAHDRITTYLQIDNMNLPMVYKLIVNWVNTISDNQDNIENLQSTALSLALLTQALLPDVSYKLSLKLGLKKPLTYSYLSKIKDNLENRDKQNVTSFLQKELLITDCLKVLAIPVAILGIYGLFRSNIVQDLMRAHGYTAAASNKI